MHGNAAVRQTMDYFRAVLSLQELSARSLSLTTKVIELNAANYTAWHFRRQCLKALSCDLRSELEFVSDIAGENPKNYQIWYHRRAIAEILEGSAPGELEYTEKVLNEDSKNYHAWSHRQWVIKHFECWDGELEFVERMISNDVRNNSAWNQRWFVVHRGLTSSKPLDDSVLRTELEYALSAAKLATKNQAPWSYIEGLMQKRKYAEFPEILVHLRKLQAESVDDSPPMMACLVAALESSEGDDAARAEAIRLCSDLETRADVIRAKYWAYRRSTIQGR